MKVRKWEELPEKMRTREVRRYYNIIVRHSGWFKVKRVMDICVSLVLLAILLIPMGIIALMIKTDSQGPVFLRQERVTQYGKIFKIYKFRTMVDNA